MRAPASSDFNDDLSAEEIGPKQRINLLVPFKILPAEAPILWLWIAYNRFMDYNRESNPEGENDGGCEYLAFDMPSFTYRI